MKLYVGKGGERTIAEENWWRRELRVQLGKMQNGEMYRVGFSRGAYREYPRTPAS